MEQENNQRLTIDDIKKIIADIEEEERKESGFNAKIKTLTTVEYYKESFKNKNFTLVKKIKNLSTPLTASGIYNFKDSSVVIFLNSYSKIIDPNKKILKFIKTCYHEIRHSLQDNLDPFCFTKFACDIDRLIAYYDSVLYDKRHDSFFFEIDANTYSIQKAKEYLEKKFPDIYNIEEIKKEIEKYDEYSYDNYILFDIGNSIEKAILLLKKHNISKEEKDDVSPLLNIFLNDDNSFKSIKEIACNKNFKNIDERIICAFFSNSYFLESLDFNNLNDYELEILNESLNYTINLYRRQQKILDIELQPYKERLDTYLKIEKNIVRKLNYLYHYKHLMNAFNNRQLKSSKAHKLHKKKLPQYLEQTRSLLSSKNNNGFVVIDVFYIVSLIISLGVIGYLILF